jgi:hypothetical protein
MGAPSDSRRRRIAMSRNSYRGLTLAIVLIVGLGMALPAAARPAERGPAIEEGLLERIWNWVGSLWTVAGGGKHTRAVSHTGILIDPNGGQGGG